MYCNPSSKTKELKHFRLCNFRKILIWVSRIRHGHLNFLQDKLYVIFIPLNIIKIVSNAMSYCIVGNEKWNERKSELGGK